MTRSNIGSSGVTFHARPDRADSATLSAERSVLASASFSLELLDLLSTPVVVVNRHRQALFINRAATQLLEVDAESAIGERPGALMQCAHEPDTPSGCGTGQACRNCGFVNGLLSAMDDGRRVVRETSLLTTNGGAAEMKISASPLIVGEQRFALAELVDLSDSRRRVALERSFFHDLLNVASGIDGLLQTIDGTDSERDEAVLDMTRSSTAQLLHEIEAQRVLAYAERGDLETNIVGGMIADTLTAAAGAVRAMAGERHTDLLIAVDPPELQLATDHTLLGRTIINLLKNAVEAGGSETVVRVIAFAVPDGVRIEIHNQGHIPDSARIFHRSYTTKGSGRGLGTFSAKLLTERYLGGSIGYMSDEHHGTTFIVTIPSG